MKTCHELDDYCKFLGKDLLETDLFERSMVAQDEAVTRILQLNKKFDTVIVYPAFGNEVSKTKDLKLCELLRLYHWQNVYEEFFSENNNIC